MRQARDRRPNQCRRVCDPRRRRWLSCPVPRARASGLSDRASARRRSSPGESRQERLCEGSRRPRLADGYREDSSDLRTGLLTASQFWGARPASAARTSTSSARTIVLMCLLLFFFGFFLCFVFVLLVFF